MNSPYLKKKRILCHRHRIFFKKSTILVRIRWCKKHDCDSIQESLNWPLLKNTRVSQNKNIFYLQNSAVDTNSTLKKNSIMYKNHIWEFCRKQSRIFSNSLINYAHLKYSEKMVELFSKERFRENSKKLVCWDISSEKNVHQRIFNSNWVLEIGKSQIEHYSNTENA